MNAVMLSKLKKHRLRLMQQYQTGNSWLKAQPSRVISASGISLNFTRHILDEAVWVDLFKLARIQELDKFIESLFAGECVNTTENRPALHHLLRTVHNTNPLNITTHLEMMSVLKKMKLITEGIHQGKIVGSSGRSFKDIVHLGIGGSVLGGELLHSALQGFVVSDLRLHFISNIDPNGIYSLLDSLNPETSLFIICTKSFTTHETLQNASVVKQWLMHKLCKQEMVSDHWIAVTEQIEKAEQFGVKRELILPLFDSVGGRYSIFSAVGLPIMLSVGVSNFDQLLSGASQLDNHFFSANWSENLPVVMGLLSIWYVNVCEVKSQAVIPYSNLLALLPNYLQQLQMESNGKSVNKQGKRIDYSTCPVIWGGVGTNSQHSFFQLLHQGTNTIPCDFILPLNHVKYPKQHQMLVMHCLAQMQALMQGTGKVEQEQQNSMVNHYVCEGRKPSSLICFDSITPKIIGQLIALYEHKTFVESVLWDINPFDQHGVELGKKLQRQLTLSVKRNRVLNPSSIDLLLFT